MPPLGQSPLQARTLLPQLPHLSLAAAPRMESSQLSRVIQKVVTNVHFLLSWDWAICITVVQSDAVKSISYTNVDHICAKQCSVHGVS